MTGTGFSSQCFPVRGLTRYKRQDENGIYMYSVFLLFVLPRLFILICCIHYFGATIKYSSTSMGRFFIYPVITSGFPKWSVLSTHVHWPR